MRRIAVILTLLLVGYSAALIGVELVTSQDFVRHWVTDIEGPVPFYAVNTTLSVFLLWATALLFVVGIACTQGLPKTERLRWFFASQVLVFTWLGADDRFKFHEYIAWRLGIGDHYILLAVATLEAAFLVALGSRHVFRRPVVWSLAAAALLFAVMIFFDACVPHDMVLRLTLEDLAKTWANVCLLGFAWRLCRERIDVLRSAKLRELAGTMSC